MDRLEAMAAFVRVAERQSFAAASRELRISPPAVSRAIGSLEDRLGARLLTRTTRTVRLTEAGQQYLEDCRRILADVGEAEQGVAGVHGALRGGLSVTASHLFGRLFVLPIVTRFLAEHPQTSVRTLFVDRLVNLMDEGVDVAVRIGELPDSSLTARRIGSVRRVVCGSPQYIADHGVPKSPEDLKSHALVAAPASQSVSAWRFFEDGSARDVTIAPRLVTSSNEAAIDAALSGWGFARLLSYQVAPELASGRLKIVLSEFEPPTLPVTIIHAEGQRVSAKLRAFVDLTAESLRRNPLIN